MLTWLKSKVMEALLGLASGAIIVLLVVLAWTNHNLSSKTAALQVAQAAIDGLVQDKRDLELRLDVQKKTNDLLNERLRDKVIEVQSLDAKLKEIENAPQDEDGDVADVLCRAITGAKCVRNN